MTKQEYMKEYHQRYYEKNKEKILARNKAWKEVNYGRFKELAAKWHRSPKGRAYERFRRTGWSPEQYEAAYKAQQGLCAICGVFKEKLDADHCHLTGKRRGLLCHLCNIALGSFRDNQQSIRRALEYLKRYQ